MVDPSFAPHTRQLCAVQQLVHKIYARGKLLLRLYMVLWYYNTTSKHYTMYTYSIIPFVRIYDACTCVDYIEDIYSLLLYGMVATIEKMMCFGRNRTSIVQLLVLDYFDCLCMYSYLATTLA